MTDSDALHLWFRPYNGVVSDSDVSFIQQYGKKFYPRAMGGLTLQLHRLIMKVTRMYKPGLFEYCMMHRTLGSTKRYVIEEYLCDAEDESGLNIGIQATTPEERKLFIECFEAGETGASATQAVQNTITYLEDSLEAESEMWANARMKNGHEALPALLEIIAFLKAVKNRVRVYSFEVNQSEKGIAMSIALLSPSVLSYYTRIDWTIV